ncbi:MAG: 23S rRNA (guanosine(2251)-2'-O)-methyltransferase RlmB [Gammaproteobacteria bacterium]|nr:23S rRNA (guanosine(2251)-2'-O)-methyltransferase RlmB [Gammaproteobacteria bacterium]
MSQRLVYGIHPVRQLLLSRPDAVERVYLQSDLGEERRARLAAVLSDRIRIAQVSADELEKLTGTPKHQGVAALATESGPLSEGAARDLLARVPRPLVLVLDGVQDPRNFGACLRTADAAGVNLVVVARHRNVDVTPVVSKVAAGAAESQALVQVSNLVRFLEALKSQGLWIVGTDDAAETSLYDVDLTTGIAMVLGAEGEGLRRLTSERCDHRVQLPMLGTVSSLNVAVATGICLYECLRQRSVADRLPRGSPLR